MKTIAGILVSFLLALDTAKSQEGVITTMETRAGSTLYLYSDSSTAKIFQDSKRVFENHRISIAPNRMLTGAISRAREFVKDKDGKESRDSKLLVFSREGKLKFTIPDVQAYAWSPDGSEIACILGRKTEGFAFESWRLIIVKAEDSVQRVIDETIRHQDIYWASFDSMIYSTDFAQVYQIDPRRGAVTKTLYKGIYFSPDGKYYFDPDYEGVGCSVYERETNKDITPKDLKENPESNSYRWLPEGSTLLVGDQFKEKTVIDIATGRKLKTVSGEVIDYDHRTKEFTVYKSKRLFKELRNSKIQKIKIEN